MSSMNSIDSKRAARLNFVNSDVGRGVRNQRSERKKKIKEDWKNRGSYGGEERSRLLGEIDDKNEENMRNVGMYGKDAYKGKSFGFPADMKKGGKVGMRKGGLARRKRK